MLAAAERDGILHMELEERVSRPNGKVVVSRREVWQRGADSRTIVTQDGVRRDAAIVGGRFQEWDPARAAIYLHPPVPTAPDDGADVQSKIELMLESAKFHEAGRTHVDGRDAIRIESADGTIVLVVDAERYVPLEWRNGAGSGTVRFLVYETLPDTAANRGLLSLSEAHPGARVVRDPGPSKAAPSKDSRPGD